MGNKVYEFTDESGTKEIYDTNQKDKLDEWLYNYIVQDIYEGIKDRYSILSAKAFCEIYDIINKAIDEFQKTITKGFDNIEDLLTFFETYKFLRIEFVTGTIDIQVKHPRTNVLYIQHSNAKDPTWAAWIYNGTEWCSIGDMDSILENFVLFSQIDEFKDELFNKIIGIIEDDAIVQTVHDTYNEIIEKADAERV